MVNQKQKELYGSSRPYEANPGISAGGKSIVDLRDKEFYKYAPFDKVNVINNSNEPITLKLDDDNSRAFSIAGNQNRTLTGRWYRLLGVINEGSNSISSGDLTIEIERRPMDADKKALKDAQEDRSVAGQVVEKFTGINPDRTDSVI